MVDLPGDIWGLLDELVVLLWSVLKDGLEEVLGLTTSDTALSGFLTLGQGLSALLLLSGDVSLVWLH